jgi:excinuclease UvrABC nuclease subunit
MSGPYSPGRPKKNKPSSGPGEYRWRDRETGEIDRIGETNNLRRRRSEYPTEKVPCSPETHDYETMEADGRSTSKTRREHEVESIERYDPQFNERAGGGGRPAEGGSGRRPKGN